MSRCIETHQRTLVELLNSASHDDAALLPLARAAGRVLARDLVAEADLPPLANSQMDGFAVRVADLTPSVPPQPGDVEGIELPVADVRPAGAQPARHTPGTATAVMTGAVLPEGADAVIPVERVRPPRFDVPAVTISPDVARSVTEGTFVRAAGSDVARGAVALPAGTRLGAAALGACAALGLGPGTEVSVRTGPRVVVVSGGDEIAPDGHAPRPGMYHDANGPLLAAWLSEAGAESVTRVRVDDDPDAFVRALDHVVTEARPHLVITSGGISAGAFEVVRQGLEREGRDTWFGHVAMQPGGPQGHGTFRGVPVICLPGNPVSTWVSCEVFVRPALAAAWGCCPSPRWFTAELGEAVRPLDTRTQLRRGSMEHPGDGTVPRVRLVGGASSHLLSAAAHADVLVRIPPGEHELAAGTTVAVLPVDGGVLPADDDPVPAGAADGTERTGEPA